jgi:hypothetical protein
VQSIFHSKFSNDAGRMISTKPVPLNASDSIRDTLNPDSNVTDESDPHSKRKSSHSRIQPVEEKFFSNKQVLLNARFSIRDTLEPDSNETEESYPQSRKKKKPSPKNSTNAGRIISNKPFSRNDSLFNS